MQRYLPVLAVLAVLLLAAHHYQRRTTAHTWHRDRDHIDDHRHRLVPVRATPPPGGGRAQPAVVTNTSAAEGDGDGDAEDDGPANATVANATAANVTRVFKPDLTPPGCPRVYMRFINDFGGHNNQLLSLLNAFTMARHLGYTLVLPNFIEGINKGPKRSVNPLSVYNFSLFRAEGYCWVPYHQKGYGPVLKYTAYQLFRVQAPRQSRPYHLLRPLPFLQAEVDRTAARLPRRYTAVHRRTEIVSMYNCRGRQKAGYCQMRAAYVRQAQLATNHSVADPIFLATDGPVPKGFNIPHVRYRGALARNKLHAVIVDFWLLVGSSLLVANPGSSLALNACNIRRMQRPPRDCFNFTFCHDREPYVSGWPCGSPVPGIATRFAPKWQQKQLAKIATAKLHNPALVLPRPARD